MIQVLAHLASQLPPGTLPPPGYYNFRQQIRHAVHLHRDGRLTLTTFTDDPPLLPRPENGRTSGSNARLIADMAKAVVPGDHELHRNYLDMLRRALIGTELRDLEVRRAVQSLLDAASSSALRDVLTEAEIGAKDWFSFTATLGGRREHLIAHPEVQRAWMALLSEDLQATTPGGVPRQGECAACGEQRPLVRRAAVKVGVDPSALVPLTSQNQGAFVSGETDFERAPIALCLACVDGASRALSWLLTTSPHHQYVHLAYRSGQPQFGSNRTVRAVAWLGSGAPLDDVHMALETITGPDDLADALPALRLPPDEADLARLWAIPRSSGVPDALALDDAFHLLLVSPIKGHAIFRSHHTLRLGDLHANLQGYQRRVAMPVLGQDAAPRLASHRDMIEAALRRRLKGRVAREDPQTGMVRAGLLQHAYVGHPPPHALLLPALHAFQDAIRHPDTGRNATLTLHALACALSLYRSDMNENAATLSGRLLAVIERAQQDSQRRQYGRASAYTVATRTISAAAARPSHVLGQLLPLATKAYLPRAGHLRPRFMTLSAELLDHGGAPARLTPHQQADFSLGYYAELHRFIQPRAEPSATGSDITQEVTP